MRDSQRALTPEGEKDIHALAQLLAGMDFDPQVIVTSNLQRARQTAAIIAERLGIVGRVIEDDRLAHGCSFGELQLIVHTLVPAQRILIVGHQPDMGKFASRLIGDGNISVPPGCLIRIDAEMVEPGRGVLKWVVPPGVVREG